MSRRKDFKIGRIHGKIQTSKGNGENEIRNQLFLIGKIRIELPRSLFDDVRIVGYEVPFGTGRDECIDLLGYNQHHDPYIFELKKANTSDSIHKITGQINRYEKHFRDLKDRLEIEVAQEYHHHNFRFSDTIRKVVLIPREFYIKKPQSLPHQEDGIWFCSFARIAINNKEGKVDLYSSAKSSGHITLKIENKQ